MKTRIVSGLTTLLCLVTGTSFAQELPLNAFARQPAVDQVTVSPDGRYLAMIRPEEGMRMAYVVDLKENTPMRRVMGGIRAGNYVMTRCRWANSTRLLCAYRAMKADGQKLYPTTRLATANADGSDFKFLIQNVDSATFSQLHDRVIDVSPQEPNIVLISVDANRNGLPAVFELDVYSGRLDEVVHEHEKVRRFISDSRGEVRFGYSVLNAEVTYRVRLAGSKNWTPLDKFKYFNQGAALVPLAVSTGNKVYARGAHEGRAALFEMNLEDRSKPTLVFSHPAADIGEPIFASDGRMLGIRYDTDRPAVSYTDSTLQSVVDSLKSVLPATNFNAVIDTSLDNQQFVIRSTSDIDDGSYFLLNKGAGKLVRIGVAYPELTEQQAKLGRMQSIRYRAADGTEIPGYLTVPAGKRAEKLPLIVMPHGGPLARDTLGFDWVVQFLASRGYAVLQMNYRGSSGYGDQWFLAAHQNFGGVSYADITDGTRWAIQQGIADPKRVCILGREFGGYAAMLAAARNSDLYKCAVSIGGVSDLIQLQNDIRDLGELQRDEESFLNEQIVREQIGENKDKLNGEAPVRNAKAVRVPLLLVHADSDSLVRVDHSRNMAKALNKEKKPHKLVEIKDADQHLSREADRVMLLTEVEAFLKEHLSST